MSKKLVSTKFPGYGLPRKDVHTEELHNLLDACTNMRGVNKYWLTMATGNTAVAEANKLATGVPKTADDYIWFWGYEFRECNCKIVMLIPWFQDWGKKDGSQADRAIAIYANNCVTTEQIQFVLDSFTDSLREVLDR